jgi:hypothetical protein
MFGEDSDLIFLTHMGAETNLLIWGALSDEKSGLYFSVLAGHRQCSVSQIWVPRDSCAYFTVYFWDSLFLEGQVAVFISPRNRVAQLYPRALGFFLPIKLALEI